MSDRRSCQFSLIFDNQRCIGTPLREHPKLPRRTLREHSAHTLPKLISLLGTVRGLFRHCESQSSLLKFAKRLISWEFNGGRDRDRTCDPYHVKVVLFR